MKSILGSFILLQAFSGLCQNVGIGTQTPLQKLHVAGNAIVTGNLGVGVTNPQAPLQLRNELGNKRIVLFDALGDDHQYFGFGINSGALRYQSDADHVFYAGQTSETSLEVLRIKENGNVGIGNANPQSRLSVSGTGEITGNTVIGGNLALGLPTAAYRLDVGGSARLNGDLFLNSSNPGGTWFFLSNFHENPTGWKLVATPDGKLKFFNTSNTSVLTLLQNGRVGIGTETPAYPLQVSGAAAVSGDFAVGGVIDFGRQVSSTDLTFTAGGINAYSITCPAGTKIVSGGGGYPGFNTDIAKDIVTIYNGPDPDFPATKWRLYMWNKNDESVPIKVFCVCAKMY